MAKKPTISTVPQSTTNTVAINTNFRNIQDQFANTLSLDGSTPNAMQTDLDLNGNDLINVGSIIKNGADFLDTLQGLVDEAEEQVTIATTQAGIATTKAGEAETSATAAAASAAEAEATAETLADLATLEQMVTDAETAQAGAETAQSAAEAARDAAFVSADVYADTEAGLAVVAEGDQFTVVSTDGQEVIRYRKDAGPVATEVARFPAAAAVVHLYGGRGGITSGVTSIGIEATDYAIIPRTLKNLRVDLDAGSALASVIIDGAIVHQVAVTGGTPSLETGLSLPLSAGDDLTLHLAVLSGTPATYSAKLWG